jgi:hypothetical protein
MPLVHANLETRRTRRIVILSLAEHLLHKPHQFLHGLEVGGLSRDQMLHPAPDLPLRHGGVDMHLDDESPVRGKGVVGLCHSWYVFSS